MTSPSEIDIANFAENLIQVEAQKTPQQRKVEAAKTAGVGDWRDDLMQEAVVPTDLVSKICEGNASLVDFTKPKVEEAKVEEEVVEKTESRNLEDLVAELTAVISKAKSLMKEMTTVGAIGVNLGGPVKQVKKKKKKKASPKYESIQKRVENILNAQLD